ncbi:hypothetical protein ES703_22472 [subsurface metagenome]
MIALLNCIEFWRIYLERNEKRLNDSNYRVIVSTMKHLSDYQKLKEQTIAKLIPKPGDDTRKGV